MLYVIFGKKQNDTYYLQMSGHCGDEKQGENLICAAASAFCLTLDEILKEKKDCLKSKPKVLIQNGFSTFDFIVKRRYVNKFDTIFETITRGFAFLQKQFPESVKLIHRGES